MRSVFALLMVLTCVASARPTMPPPPVDSTDVTEVTVLNQSYVPLKGQQQIESTYATVDQFVDYKVSGFQVAKILKKATVLGVSYFYGLNDDVAIGARVLQSLSSSSMTKFRNLSTGTDEDDKSSGTYDPQIGLNWRMKHDHAAGFDLDFRALYSPKLMPAREATTSQDGLVGKGAHSLSLLLALTRHSGPAEVGGTIEKTINGDSSMDDGAGGTKTGTDDGRLALSAFYLYHMNRFYLGGELALSQIGGTSSTSNNVKSSADATTAKTVTLRAKYLLTETSGLALSWMEEDTASMKATSTGTSFDIDDLRLMGTQLSYTVAF